MSLRNKTLLLLSLVLAGLLLLVLGTGYKVVLQGFYRVEQQEATMHVRQVRAALDYELKKLGELVGDWAAWDHTYAFVARRAANLMRSPSLVEGDFTGHYLSFNFSKETFRALQLNLVLVLAREGKTLYARHYDLSSQTFATLPADLLSHLREEEICLPGDNARREGLLWLREGVLLLACHPIPAHSPNESSGGMVLMGRFLGPILYSQIQRIIAVEFSMHPVNPTALVSAEVGEILFHPASSRLISASTLLPDAGGQHYLRLEVHLPRKIYALGQFTLYSMLGMGLALGLVFIGIILWLFEYLVLRRVARLGREVGQIRDYRDPSRLVTVDGGDELGNLATVINHMLSALAQVQQMEITLQRLGKVMDSASEEIFLCDPQSLRLIQVNHTACHKLGYRDEELLQLSLDQVCLGNPEDWSEIQGYLAKIKQEYIFEGRHHRRDGSEYPVEMRLHYHAPPGESPLIIAIGNDISRRRRAEEQAFNLLRENRQLIQHSLDIQEQERKHLVRELHDEFGQCLSAIQADANLLSTTLPEKSPGQASAAAILSISGHMYDTMHTIMRRLRPPVLDALGLNEALRDSVAAWQQRHPGIQVEFQGEAGVDRDLDEGLAINLFRVVQECLTNVAKHARASRVEVKLWRDETPSPPWLNLEVRDNGRGLSGETDPHGLGLIGIRERAEAFGGIFRQEGAPGQGTRIFCGIPLSG